MAPASRRRDHATSPYANVLFVVRPICVHRIPLPTFLTIAKRPSQRVRDCATYTPIQNFGKAKYFLQEGWTNARDAGSELLDLPVAPGGDQAMTRERSHRERPSRTMPKRATPRGNVQRRSRARRCDRMRASDGVQHRSQGPVKTKIFVRGMPTANLQRICPRRNRRSGTEHCQQIQMIANAISEATAKASTIAQVNADSRFASVCFCSSRIVLTPPLGTPKAATGTKRWRLLAHARAVQRVRAEGAPIWLTEY